MRRWLDGPGEGRLGKAERRGRGVIRQAKKLKRLLGVGRLDWWRGLRGTSERLTAAKADEREVSTEGE